MGAPKKNKFWKARSRHGREKIFTTPEILEEAANEYFKWCVDNPLYEVVIQGGKAWSVPKMRAMTLAGLCIFMDVQTSTFNNYCDKSNDSYKDFLQVTTRIKEIIYSQKFEGAAAGFLNANIIARDLGLKEKAETEHTIKTDMSEYSTKELIERAKAVSKIKNE